MENKKSFKISSYIAVFCWLVLPFIAGFYLGTQGISEPPKDLPKEADLSIIWKVWEKIEERYVGKVDYEQMIYGAAKGIAESLDDPYTVFYTPEESKLFKEGIAGVFEGVGMEVGIRDGELTVIAPLEGTPAKKAGLLAGDRIVKIDDTFTSGMVIDAAVSEIRGRRGTEVTLTIMREGWDTPKEFVIVRDLINIPSIKLEILDEGIAHLIVYQFNENMSYQFREATNQISEAGVKKIILDLRNNPGGLLHRAQELAGWFLEKGSLVLIEQFADGQEKEYKAKGNAKFLNYDLVVLINQGTASGAEILAAALKENRSDVQLIGEKTFGKGSVQEALDIKKGSVLKVTIAHWLTPKRRVINKIGLEPDIEIKISEEDLEEGEDPQLEKAKEILMAF